MEKIVRTAFLAASMAAVLPSMGVAQDKVEASVGGDLVNQYIWRGCELGSVAFQPNLGVAYKGFSLAAWGSVGFDKEDTKEFDVTLGYETGGFSIGTTCYWFAYSDPEIRNRFFEFSSHSTAHVFEAYVGYDFGPLALTWYTNYAGADGLNKSGKRAYSSYASITAPFTLGGLDWTAEVGVSPWSNTFYTDTDGGFSVCNVAIGACKEIKITNSFSLPLFTQLVWNPASQGAYFIFGMSF
ncbi:MAG: hypothetical protein ACRC3Z_02025 [Phocaeicola sp.]